MSPHHGSPAMPTRPFIPQQRSTTRVFAPEPDRSGSAAGHPGGIAGRWLAVLRLATGAAFLWVAVQQSPTASGAVEWVWIAGLTAVGLGVALGVGLRIAAGTGSALLVLAWAAGWPMAAVAASGHESSAAPAGLGGLPLVYALVLVVLAVTHAGRTWGLGRGWAALPVVRRHHWMI